MALKDPVARAEYNRQYRLANRDHLNAYHREWYQRNYPRIRPSLIAQSPNTPAMHAAQQRVYKAIKRGELVRPDVCSECGEAGYIEAAHENYTERLAIRWLCRRCHREWDAREPKHEGAA